MAKRSPQETRYETRRREVARKREDTVAYAPPIPTNRTERRLMGDTSANRMVPKFRSVEEADRWMEKQERIAYRQRALMTETRDPVWPAVWQRGVQGSSPHMHEVDVAEWF